MSLLRFAAAEADWLCGGVPVVVTGAGGWLGQAALEMLDFALGRAFSGQVAAFAATARPITLRSGRIVALLPLTALAAWDGRPPVIFHFAFLTREHAGRMGNTPYVAANRAISAAVAGFIERKGAAGLVLPSSGAVYGATGALETDLARNPYGALKHEDEVLFTALAAAHKFPVSVIRVFNLAGPFINKLGSYALASIIQDIARGGPVVLRAAHPVWRSYTHVEDILRVAMGMIRLGIVAPALDTAGEVIEIGALAARAATLLAPGQDLTINRPNWQLGAPDRYLGKGESYFRLAGACGMALRSLDEQILSTAAYIGDQR